MLVVMMHTAYMLILGETLIEMKDQLRGNVVIIHQPAEATGRCERYDR